MNTEPDQKQPSILHLAFADGTPKRAFLTALVVGTILIAINHGEMLIQDYVPPFYKIALTYLVPYCVTTWGAVTGKLAQHKRHNKTKL